MDKSNDNNEQKRKKAVLTMAVLILLTSVVFANTFQNDFVGYDDQNLIINNDAIRDLSPDGVVRMFIPRFRGSYQPLRTLSFAVDYAVWGMQPFGFHLTNLILHVAGVICVWLLFRKVMTEKAALLGAIIFAVHPINVESVTWMSARKDVLSLVFFLAAILLFEKSESEGKPSAYFASIFATALALLSKLTAVSIPLCIFLFEVCRGGVSGPARIRRLIIRIIPIALVVCLIVGLNLVRLGNQPLHSDPISDLDVASKGVTRDIHLSMPLVTCRYLGLLLVPYHLNTHYDVTRVSSMLNPDFIIPTALIFGIACVGIACFLRGQRLAAMWLGWMAATFLPTSNIIPVGAMMTDRYMHMPSVGFAALAAAALVYPTDYLSSRGKSSLRLLALIPPVVVVLLFSALTIRRNADWRDTKSLFTRTLMVNPKSIDGYLAIGAVHMEEGDVASAIEDYHRGLEIDPEYYRINLALGMAYLRMGGLNDALKAFEKVPDSRKPYPKIADIYYRQKRYPEAIAAYKEAIRIWPESAEARAALGHIYLETGDPEHALPELNRALEIRPDMIPAISDRATLFIGRGMFENAETDLLRLEALGVDTRRLRAGMPAVPEGTP